MGSYQLCVQKTVSPDIIRIDNANDIANAAFNYNENGVTVKWVNLNVKHKEKYHNTGIWERNIGVKDRRGQDIYFRLSNASTGGNGYSNDPYVLNGFYDGGTFNVSFSANDEVTGTQEVPQGEMMKIRTYTIPRIGLDDNITNKYNSYSVPRGSLENPLEVKANASSFSLTVEGLSKCIHSSYETTRLYYTRYLHNETSTPYSHNSSSSSLGNNYR